VQFHTTHRLACVLVSVIVLGCGGAAPTPPPVVPDPYAALPAVEIDRRSKITIDSLTAALTVRQKVGQLIMPWLLGNYAAYDSEEYDTLRSWVDSLEIGGIIISIGPPLEIGAKLNALQRRSTLPLLIAADLEYGSAMRVRGGTEFPVAMAVAAGGQATDAYELGRVTAEEARALGIHMTFSPVADLNSNPANPVINTRSFGEDPDAAAPLLRAYVSGARQHGLYTTAKHFPGHGDTDVDSHISLPVVRACWDRLDSLELAPFRTAIRAGVTAVMTAHVAAPCVTDERPDPATLSPRIMTEILRDSLGFEGLVVTDALDMGAIVRAYGPGESAVLAFLAGSDLILMPTDPRAAIDAMVAAVDSGRIPMERLDRSLRRLLRLKADAGLFDRRTVELDSIPTIVGKREYGALADAMATRSITVVEAGPLSSFRAQRGSEAVVVYGRHTSLSAGNALAAELRALGDTVTTFRLYPSSGPASYDSARAVIDAHPRTIFAVHVRAVSGLGSLAVPAALDSLMGATSAATPTLLVSFGNPYLLSELTDFRGGYVLAWSGAAAAERAAAGAIAGGTAIGGRLPISLSPDHPRGGGIAVGALQRDGRDSVGGAEDADGFDPAALTAIDPYLDEQVADSAFPGAVLFVGHRGSIAYRTAAGHYATTDMRPVTDTTVYDLASLTKVIGLTTAAMLLVDAGLLELDQRVVDYLPEFTGPLKEDVLVRHLLLHTSGLPAWVPLYAETASADEAVQRVLSSPLESAPGTEYVYSDLGAITLTQLVERVSGQPLDAFLQERVFGPLEMRRTRFRPPSEWLPFIAPTELDPWRNRLVHGEVHDENAFRLGGVSGHAGLFSDGSDLMRFAFWMLDAWHGRLAPEGTPYLPAHLVQLFTRRQSSPAGSTRALGWDTPSDHGRSSAGTLMSRASFGHTGFTGTSIWIEPERELVVILLTNRVNPTRENRAILDVRGAVADLVVGALQGRAATPQKGESIAPVR
jgi:beta-glucosidase-like glycosyl hydrolase/CubicO group peptidase (beta-lactamase class C family)